MEAVRLALGVEWVLGGRFDFTSILRDDMEVLLDMEHWVAGHHGTDLVAMGLWRVC